LIVMTDHRIQFRGGWEAIRPGAPPERLTLPVAWPIAASGLIRLVRRFGRPPVDPAAETIRLELRDVPGLIGLRLNALHLGGPAPGVEAWVVPLDGHLDPRNVLTIEVDLVVANLADLPAGWGRIALVIGLNANDRDSTGRSGGVE
jgi:hypothetical protein